DSLSLGARLCRTYGAWLFFIRFPSVYPVSAQARLGPRWANLNTVHLSKKEPWELRAVRGCLGLTLGRRVMHGTSIQTPAERWSYRRRVGHGDFGTNLSYGSGARDFAAARQ